MFQHRLEYMDPIVAGSPIFLQKNDAPVTCCSMLYSKAIEHDRTHAEETYPQCGWLFSDPNADALLRRRSSAHY